MPWVRQRQPKSHECNLPSYTNTSFGRHMLEPIGTYNDLYRCDECSQLWRVGRACDACESSGIIGHGGACVIGLKWRPASWLQQIFYRKR